jgi:hypothetical protein
VCVPNDGLEDGRHDHVIDVGIDVLQEGRVDLKDDRLEVVEEDRHRIVVVLIARLA